MKRRDGFLLNGKPLKPESLMMSYGYDPALSEGALKCPIFQTSTFVFKKAEEGKASFEIAYNLPGALPPDRLGLIYSRLNNPDLEILEDRLTLWDEAESCAVFPSGMAAISTTLLEFLRPGDLLLYTQPLYGGTAHFFEKYLPNFGIQALGVKVSSTYEDVNRLLRDTKKTGRLALVYVETPANPTNELADIRSFAKIAKEASTSERPVPVVVDNTFLGPLWQHPLKHGADLVIYSATKFIGGHSDVIAGVCLGSENLINRIKTLRTFLGTIPDAWSGWLLLRSLETLKVRMTAQAENAKRVADFLAKHPKVERVYYLGHLKKGSSQYELFMRQCTSAGSMISFDIAGNIARGEAQSFQFLNSLKLIQLAVSLGGTESLAEHPASMTHSDIPPAERARFGITDKLIRLSMGIEDADDLIRDLEQALGSVK